MSRPNPHEVQNIRRLRSHLGECTVLLKKDGSFPLEKAGTIAAYGSGVRRTIKGGTGSGEVNSRYFINVERGLIKAGFTVVSTDWLDAYDRIREDNKKAFYRGIREKAKKNGATFQSALPFQNRFKHASAEGIKIGSKLHFPSFHPHKYI